ncbi:hypothetical protein LX36DRAFT_349175 [Colletotrichum falcatum]|nr:hypothetical protein LX36DRAFT_349175 [Colletotrichum falcatum]
MTAKQIAEADESKGLGGKDIMFSLPFARLQQFQCFFPSCLLCLQWHREGHRKLNLFFLLPFRTGLASWTNKCEEGFSKRKGEASPERRSGLYRMGGERDGLRQNGNVFVEA